MRVCVCGVIEKAESRADGCLCVCVCVCVKVERRSAVDRSVHCFRSRVCVCGVYVCMVCVRERDRGRAENSAYWFVRAEEGALFSSLLFPSWFIQELHVHVSLLFLALLLVFPFSLFTIGLCLLWLPNASCATILGCPLFHEVDQTLNTILPYSLAAWMHITPT